MILRTIECAVCKKKYTEEKENDGFAGWGQIGGVVLNGDSNPHLCPDHLATVANFIDSMVK